MSEYPIWWDSTITIYNKFEDSQTHVVTWSRTTLNNCFWKYSGNKVVVNDVVLESNNVICRIPKNYKFLEKYEWVNKPNDLMSNYFTLGQGDIIVKGEVTDTINEYQSGKRSSDLLKKYKGLQGCMEVQEFSLNVGSGRCCEHYFVKGI